MFRIGVIGRARSVQPSEVLQVYERRSDYGILDGVWYCVSPLDGIDDAARSHWLDDRWGLEHDDLLRLHSAAELPIDVKGFVKAWKRSSLVMFRKRFRVSHLSKDHL